MKGYYGDLRTWGTRSSPKNTCPPPTNATGTIYYEQANKKGVNPTERNSTKGNAVKQTEKRRFEKIDGRAPEPYS